MIKFGDVICVLFTTVYRFEASTCVDGQSTTRHVIVHQFTSEKWSAVGLVRRTMFTVAEMVRIPVQALLMPSK